MGNIHSYVVPFLTGLIINFLIAYETGPLTPLFWYVGLILFFSLFSTVIRFVSKYVLVKIGAISRKRMRLEALKKMISLDLKWHSQQDSGTKVSKINTGSDSIRVAMGSIMNDWFPIFMGLIIGSVLLFLISWKFGVFALIVIFIFLYSYLRLLERLQHNKKETLKVLEKTEGNLYETTSNILALKSLGVHKKAHKNAEKLEDETINTFMRERVFSFKKSIKMLSIISVAEAIFLLFVIF